jgi:dTDP-4-dehydrorhamnose reductase
VTRVLVLGGAGMLGHRLYLAARDRFTTMATVRSWASLGAATTLFERSDVIEGVDAFHADTVPRAFAAARPEVVVNCIGLVKQRSEAKEPLSALEVNAVLPHRLAALCEASGARFIHLSTDCVFSGARGRYSERDHADADDLYGRTKLLGEVSTGRALTLRTSMIGRELGRGSGLLEWFLAQDGRAPGFTRAVFSGLTTTVLANLICELIEHHPELRGLYHVAAESISKYDLLRLASDAFGVATIVEPTPGPSIDRSLDGRKFADATAFTAPSWPDMLKQLAADPLPYERIRKHDGA